jgi:IclR family transcriptional regulator, pca regulon regulatory protein
LVTANVQVGSTLPAVYISMGKVMLATLPETELDALLPPEEFSHPVGPNAIRDLAGLKEQLVEIRALGYAVQDEELASGLRSVSVPITARSLDVPTAINVAVAAHRRSVADLVGPLLEAARGAAADIISRMEER